VAARYSPMRFALETERLSMELRTRKDALWNWELLRERETPVERSMSDVEARLIKQELESRSSGIGFLTIRRKIEGDPIGYCGLFIGRSSLDEPELAYELFSGARGNGYATEAARAVLDAGFATGRGRIWSTVRIWNDPSLRVLDKLGFRRHHSEFDEHGELVYLACEKMSHHAATVWLRPVVDADLELFYRHQADPEASEMAAFPSRDYDAFMHHWSVILPQATSLVRAIIADDECVGYVSSWGLTDKPLVGYWVDRSHWGRGIATEALRQFATRIEPRPLYAMVADRNAGSIRVLEKVGFVREGGPDASPVLGADGVGEFVYVLE